MWLAPRERNSGLVELSGSGSRWFTMHGTPHLVFSKYVDQTYESKNNKLMVVRMWYNDHMKRFIKDSTKAFAAAGITLVTTSGLIAASVMPAAASPKPPPLIPPGATALAPVVQIHSYMTTTIENDLNFGRTYGQWTVKYGGPGPYHLLQQTVARGAVKKLNYQFPQIGWAQSYGQQAILFEGLGERYGPTAQPHYWCVYGLYVAPGIEKTDPKWFQQAGLPNSPGKMIKSGNASFNAGVLMSEPYGQFWNRVPGTCGRAGTPATAPSPQNIRAITQRSGMHWLRSEEPLLTHETFYFSTAKK